MGSDWHGDVQDLTLPVGFTRDEVLAVLLERTGPDGRLVRVETLDGGAGLRLRWENRDVRPAE